MSRTLIATTNMLMDTKSDALTWTAADASNNHYYIDDGNTMLLVQNGDTGGAKSITVVAVVGSNVTITAAANDTTNDSISAFGLPTGANWRQAGTNQIFVNIDDDTKTRFAAVRINRFA